MLVKVLMENTACSAEFCAEHGLCLYIETGGRRILFDMGPDDAFVRNAEKLGVDLSAVDLAVLSHGHDDHGGGLGTFLTVNGRAPVYVSRCAFEKHGNAQGKDIGLDPALAENPRLVFVGAHCRIAEGLELFAGGDCPCVRPVDPAGLTMEQNGQTLPEDFRHEQYLLVHEGSKRILFSGCSHRGVLNLAERFEPDVLIGGFHFMKLDPAGPDRAVLQAAAEQLLQHRTRYYTCHCTGTVQYEYLKRTMGDRLFYLSCGQTLEL